MVKVLFRPNTANRSQEPPTPVPPSVYTMYVSPIPYEAYDPVMVLLPEIQVPDYDDVVIVQRSPSSQQDQGILDRWVQGFNFGTPFMTGLEKSYDPEATYEIQFFNLGEQVLAIPTLIELYQP